MSLKPINTVGYNASLFHIDSEEARESGIVYYMFEEGANLYADDWDILGIRWITQTPLLLELRLLHIEEEMLEPEWHHFHALKDAGSYLSFDPFQLDTLIQFLRDILSHDEKPASEHGFLHFHSMNHDELAAIHLMQWQIGHGLGRYYQYDPSAGLQSVEKMSVLRFPKWSSKYGTSQGSSLACVTFESQRLADPRFNPFDPSLPWSGIILFDRPALNEFVTLLEQHTFR